MSGKAARKSTSRWAKRVHGDVLFYKRENFRGRLVSLREFLRWLIRTEGSKETSRMLKQYDEACEKRWEKPR